MVEDIAYKGKWFLCSWSLYSKVTDMWVWVHTLVTRANYREDPSNCSVRSLFSRERRKYKFMGVFGSAFNCCGSEQKPKRQPNGWEVVVCFQQKKNCFHAVHFSHHRRGCFLRMWDCKFATIYPLPWISIRFFFFLSHPRHPPTPTNRMATTAHGSPAAPRRAVPTVPRRPFPEAPWRPLPACSAAASLAQHCRRLARFAMPVDRRSKPPVP